MWRRKGSREVWKERKEAERMVRFYYGIWCWWGVRKVCMWTHTYIYTEREREIERYREREIQRVHGDLWSLSLSLCVCVCVCVCVVW